MDQDVREEEKRQRPFVPIFSEPQKIREQTKGNMTLNLGHPVRNRPGAKRTNDHRSIRSSRDRMSSTQAQILWTFFIAMTIAIVGLTRLQKTEVVSSEIPQGASTEEVQQIQDISEVTPPQTVRSSEISAVEAPAEKLPN